MNGNAASDLEKIKAAWRKASSLFEKKEWSGAVIRAAIAIETAADLVIREELEVKRKLDADFVDNLLAWADGSHGKLTRIILPLLKNSERFTALKKIREQVVYIDEERNSIVRSGINKQRRTAERVLTSAHEIIETLVSGYHESFELRSIKVHREKAAPKRKKKANQQFTLFSADLSSDQ
jgi:3-dehydroquinate dehydratase